MKRTIFNTRERVRSTDLTSIGEHAVEAVSTLAGDALGWPHHWAAFTVAKSAATRLSISPGHLFVGAAVYDLDAAAELDLTSCIPTVIGYSVWVAVIASGGETVDQALAAVRSDVDTAALTYTSVDKTRRWAVAVTSLAGTPNLAPDKPMVPAGNCVLAWLKVDLTGILADTIEVHLPHRVKSVYEIEARLTIVEADLALVTARTASLATDIAALGAAQRTIPRPEIIRQMQRDLGRLSRKIDLPAEAVAWGYDPGLVTDMWDMTHADAMFRVREGIRFAYASITDNRLALATPGDPKLKIVGGLALPAWTEEVILEVDGVDGYKDISDKARTTVDAVENTISQTSISHGPTIQVCENQKEWAGVSTVHASETFQSASGATFISLGETTNTNNTIAGFDAEAWNSDPANEGHKNYSVEQLIVDSWTTTYTTYITHTYGVTGSIYGQTFTNSQMRVVTSIGLKTTRVGSESDLNLFMCGASSTGLPRYSKTLGHATAAPAALAVGWNALPISKPVLAEAGTRYGWFTVTSGNHALQTVTDNKYAQGSLFWSTDGAWAQGSTTEDFCMRLYAAKFAATRTVVDFTPVNLENGMTEIQLLYRGWSPAGTQLTWEYKPAGDDEWHTLSPAATVTGNPLANLPSQIALRATFLGTTELQPAIQLDETARVCAMRHRSDFRAVSKPWALGLSSSTIVMVTTWDNFDEQRHTAANKIITAAGLVVAPSSTTIDIDETKPTRRTITSIFNLATPTTSVRLRPEATTSTVVVVPFIQDISFHAL